MVDEYPIDILAASRASSGREFDSSKVMEIAKTGHAIVPLRSVKTLKGYYAAPALAYP